MQLEIALLIIFVVGLAALCVGFYFGKRYSMHMLVEALRLVDHSEQLFADLQDLAESIKQDMEDEGE